MSEKKKRTYLLLSLVIAFFLWVYVTSVVNPEWQDTFRSVSVTLDGENILAEKNLMVLMDYEPTAAVRLEGNRTDLVNINRNNLSLVADLTKITEPGEYYLSYSVVPPADISGDVAIVQRDPDKILVKVVESASKPVPVQIVYTGTMPQNYIMDKGNEVLDHTEITVSGPKEVVDKIHHAAITVDCEDRTESFVEHYRYSLRDEAGNAVDAQWITTKVEQIRLEVKVSALKKIPLRITVHAGGGATEDNSEILIDPTQISVSGSDAALAALTELNLGTVNLGEITENTTLEFPIVLPENIKNESNLTKATVSISFPELSKKEITVTNIQTENVPQGMEAELLTKQLTVTVRGPKAQLETIKPEHIIVTLDLTGISGTDTLTPSITFADGYEDVGTVGKYTISVTVAEPAQTQPTQPTED